MDAHRLARDGRGHVGVAIAVATHPRAPAQEWRGARWPGARTAAVASRGIVVLVAPAERSSRTAASSARSIAHRARRDHEQRLVEERHHRAYLVERRGRLHAQRGRVPQGARSPPAAGGGPPGRLGQARIFSSNSPHSGSSDAARPAWSAGALPWDGRSAPGRWIAAPPPRAPARRSRHSGATRGRPRRWSRPWRPASWCGHAGGGAGPAPLFSSARLVSRKQSEKALMSPSASGGSRSSSSRATARRAASLPVRRCSMVLWRTRSTSARQRLAPLLHDDLAQQRAQEAPPRATDASRAPALPRPRGSALQRGWARWSGSRHMARSGYRVPVGHGFRTQARAGSGWGACTRPCTGVSRIAPSVAYAPRMRTRLGRSLALLPSLGLLMLAITAAPVAAQDDCTLTVKPKNEARRARTSCLWQRLLAHEDRAQAARRSPPRRCPCARLQRFVHDPPRRGPGATRVLEG